MFSASGGSTTSSLLGENYMMALLQKVTVASAVSLAIGLLSSHPAFALAFKFTKIADTNTIAPGTTLPFSDFDPPSISGKNVAFGSYAFIQGKLKRLTIGCSRDGRETSAPAISGGNVVCAYANGYGVGSEVAVDRKGVKSVVANTSTPIPGGVGNFYNFGVGYPSGPRQQLVGIAATTAISGDTIAFFGANEPTSSYKQGLYTLKQGQLSKIVDADSQVPGGTGTFGNNLFTYFFIGGVGVSGNRVVFSTFSGFQAPPGIFLSENGTLKLVAKDGTPLANGTGVVKLAGLAVPSISGRNIVFAGLNPSSGSSTLCYLSRDGKVSILFDADQVTPSGISLASLTSPSISGKAIAFLGFQKDTFKTGLYTNLGGSFIKVIATDDVFMGKQVKEVKIGRRSISGNSLTFAVIFTDNSQAVYRADAVMPAAAGTANQANELNDLEE
jgi:hypothetical protein